MYGAIHLSNNMQQSHRLYGDGSRIPQTLLQLLSTPQLPLFQKTCQNLSFASVRLTVRHLANAACRGFLACLFVDVMAHVPTVVQTCRIENPLSDVFTPN